MKSCIFLREADTDILVRRTEGTKRCVILLHGFGANFEDLTGIADVVDPGEHWDWFFPNGHLEVAFNMAYAGRSWFPIDLLKRAEAMSQGIKDDPRELPPGLKEASDRIQGLIKSLSARYQTLVVGGFSQGAMVSCDAALHSEIPVHGLLQLSGRMLARDRWAQALEQKQRRFPTFQSHGIYDPILQYTGAEELCDFLKKHEFPTSFHKFNGGHEIPYPIIRELQIFLQSIL